MWLRCVTLYDFVERHTQAGHLHCGARRLTASYIVCAVIAAPALTKLGVPDFAAHIFIFYSSCWPQPAPVCC